MNIDHPNRRGLYFSDYGTLSPKDYGKIVANRNNYKRKLIRLRYEQRKS